MAEYGATSNYKLPFPTDEADTDIAGDIKNLALGVDNAIGLNWDTATDEQKAAVGNATAPVRLFGSGRPDAAGLNLSAPTGSTYTFNGTQSELDAVFGARMWRKGPDAWVCVEGVCETDPNKAPVTDRWGQIQGSVRRDGTAVTLNIQFTANTQVTNVSGPVKIPYGFRRTQRHTLLAVISSSVAANSVIVSDPMPVAYVRADGGNGADLIQLSSDPTWANGYTGRISGTWVTADPWPSSEPLLLPGQFIGRTVEELRELIEAEADPEKLQALRDELTALTGTRPGDDEE